MHFNIPASTYFLLFTLFFTFTHNAQSASIAFYKRGEYDEDSDNTRSMRCPTDSLGGAGLYGDLNNCNRYYYCTAGDPVPSVQYCQTGTLFSTNLRRCVAASRVVDECR
ncbi:hypothetical protein BDF20DRAFT_596113 [Mycotypha africana]|uniref:uncharacterized protein n=1 Tax=Mycotypha africana TaxID=64632 RepID=UPI002300F571|nr:uncharacterized protein BDF20DRAFT_596113 [Mycotypha africana]KAI8975258.1 hypothetical protein BDF20DRAFT_596113 [Mycotypha africana]